MKFPSKVEKIAIDSKRAPIQDRDRSKHKLDENEMIFYSKDSNEFSKEK